MNNSTYLGSIPNAVVFDESKGTKLSALVKIKNTDGTIITADSTLSLSKSTEALIFVSVATSDLFEKASEMDIDHLGRQVHLKMAGAMHLRGGLL